jgi:Subtilase family
LKPGAYSRDSVLAIFDSTKTKNPFQPTDSQKSVQWLVDFARLATGRLHNSQKGYDIAYDDQISPKFSRELNRVATKSIKGNAKVCGKQVVRFKIKPRSQVNSDGVPSKEPELSGLPVDQLTEQQVEDLIEATLSAIDSSGASVGKDAIDWPMPSGVQFPGGYSQWAINRVYYKGTTRPGDIRPSLARVAILDTGMNSFKPYKGCQNMLPSENRNVCTDDYASTGLNNLVMKGHGTGVASVIAGDSLENIQVGVAPGAQLWPMKVCGLSDFELGRKVWTCPTPSVVEAICEAAAASPETRPDVINLSVSGFVPDHITRRAIQDANTQGILVVSAAGNSGAPNSGSGLPENKSNNYAYPNASMYPAAFANNGQAIIQTAVAEQEGKIYGLISVAATDINDQRFPYSSNNIGVSLSAPGQDVSVYSSDAKTMQLVSGTSFAAPYVSGAAAMMVAKIRGKTPSMNLKMDDVIRIKFILENTASFSQNTDCTNCGKGVLNITEALKAVNP